MKILRYLVFLFVLAFAANVSLMQEADEVEEIENPPQTPIMTIEPVEVVPIGQPIWFRIQMKNENDRLLPNLPIILYLDGTAIRRVRTDEDGLAAIRLNTDTVGEFEYTIEFIGTEAYLSVSQTIPVTVRPAVVSVQTIPSLHDVKFKLGNRIFITDENGLAQIEVSEIGDYTLEAMPLEDDMVNDATKAEFQRWHDSTFTVSRVINVKNDVRYEAGYIISHRVQQDFKDLEGLEVAQDRIETITIKTSTGDIYTFEDGQPRWLRSTRINRNRTGLEATTIQYSIESVFIDGSNTVNKYQQRFLVNPDDTWTVELLMYYAQIQAYDAVFGFPVGDGINLEYPDGRVEYLAYDENNLVSIGPMARGTYKVEPMGVGGMKNATPIALSRFQNVRLKVVTYLDMGLAVFIGAMCALVPLLYGRPFLIKLPIIIWRDARDFLAARRRKQVLKPVHEPAATQLEGQSYDKAG